MPNTPEDLVEIATELPPSDASQGENSTIQSENSLPVDKPFLTEDSVLKAGKEDHKKAARGGLRGGRPRNDDLPRGTVTRATPISFPRPPFTVYKSDATNPHQKSKAFYSWWNALPSWAKDRSLLYVYRTWPILKMIQEDTEGNKELGYIDKVSGSEPVQDDVDLLHKYGAGSYFMRFNESPGSTVASIWAVNLGADNLLANPRPTAVSAIRQTSWTCPTQATRVTLSFFACAGNFQNNNLKRKQRRKWQRFNLWNEWRTHRRN